MHAPFGLKIDCRCAQLCTPHEAPPKMILHNNQIGHTLIGRGGRGKGTDFVPVEVAAAEPGALGTIVFVGIQMCTRFMMSFWNQLPPKPTDAARKRGPMRASMTIADATSLTAAPDTSHAGQDRAHLPPNHRDLYIVTTATSAPVRAAAPSAPLRTARAHRNRVAMLRLVSAKNVRDSYYLRQHVDAWTGRRPIQRQAHPR